MKKIWNWLTEDFDACYDQEPLMPNSIKEWLLTLVGSSLGLGFLLLMIYAVAAIERLMN